MASSGFSIINNKLMPDAFLNDLYDHYSILKTFTKFSTTLNLYCNTLDQVLQQQG